MTPITDTLVQSIGFVASFGGTFAAAAVGSRATMRSVNTWYPTLRKPSWVPSGRTIGLIWTVLYVLMAAAAWLVWRDQGVDAWPALGLFAVQLALNALWSILFFGRRDPDAAFVGILALWGAILATLVAFWAVDAWAGMLFVPYLVWVTFAGNLNRIVANLNPKTALRESAA